MALRTRTRSKASKPTLRRDGAHTVASGNGGGGAEPRSGGGNGKGATATVTWCGCGRGESFGGYETRRGECIGTPFGTGSGRWRARNPVNHRKRDEPHDWQRDATSPRPPSGGNRRGGAKPRGRNGISEGGSLGDRSRWRHRWEWTLGREVGGGEFGSSGRRTATTCRGGTAVQLCPDESQERRSRATRSGLPVTSSGGEPRPEGPHAAGPLREKRNRRGGMPSEHLEDPRGDA